MRTPAQALLWELWRISRWELIIRTVGQSVCWVGISWLLEGRGESREALAGFALVVIAGTSFFSGVWMNDFDNNQAGYCFRLQFSRPISTPVLVVVPLAYIACTSALCFLIPAALIRWLFDIPFPLLAGSVFTISCCVCLVGAVWSAPTLLTKMMSLACVVGAFGGLLVWRNAQPGVVVPMLISTKDWPMIFHVSIPQYAGLLLVVVSAAAVTTIAVGRQRHGEQFHFGGLRQWLSGLTDGLPRRTRPFGTPIRAQFWFEMRRFGLKVLLIGLCAAPLAFVVISLCSLFHEELRDQAVYMWLAVVVLCPFVYQILGAEWSLGLRRRQGAVWLSTFEATQGLSNDRLIVVKLAVLTLSVLAGSLAMVGAAAAHTAIGGDFRELVRAARAISPIIAEAPAFSWVALAINTIVLYVSSSALIVAVGFWISLYRRMPVAVFTVVFAHILLAIWDLQHGWSLSLLWSAYGWMLATAIVFVGVVALRKSLRWGYLGRRAFVGALCAWAVFVLATVAASWEFVSPVAATVPAAALALGLAMMTVPLAAAGIAPLALAAQRHK